MIQKVWCFPEVWLLFLSKRQYLISPFDALKQELRNFILKKIQENKTKGGQQIAHRDKINQSDVGN